MYDGAESGVLMTASSSINETGLQKQQGPQTLWQRIMQKVFKVSTHRGHTNEQLGAVTDAGQDDSDWMRLSCRIGRMSRRCVATGHCAAECADESRRGNQLDITALATTCGSSIMIALESRSERASGLQVGRMRRLIHSACASTCAWPLCVLVSGRCQGSSVCTRSVDLIDG